MPGLPFAQLPKMTPYSAIEEQSKARYSFYETQEEELKGQMLTDTDYNKGVVGLQKQWDTDKEALSQGKRSLDKIQKLVDEGLINPEAGEEAMWRLVLPQETEQAMFPREARGPRPFSPQQLESQQEFMEPFIKATPSKWRIGRPNYSQEDLMGQYLKARQQIGYNDPSWTPYQRQQFNFDWDNLMRSSNEYEWDPGSPEIKALRGRGKLQDAAAKQITPLASSVRKDVSKKMSKWRVLTEPMLAGPMIREWAGKETPTKTLDAGTAQKILDEAGGDRNKARELAKQRGYKL